MDLNVNRGKSLGTSIRDIYAPCFYGESSPVNVTLPDARSKSLLYSTPISFGFKTHPDYLKEQARASDFVYNPIIKVENNEPYAYLRTGSGNAVRFHASGLFDQGFFSPVYLPWDELEIQRWRDVTEKDNTISLAKKEKEGGLVIGPEKLVAFDPRDTPLQKYVTPILAYEGPNNSFGKWVSRVANTEQDFRNLFFDNTHRNPFNKEIVALIEHLNLIGYDNPRELIGIGSEVMPVGAGAGHYHDNGTSVIVASYKIYEEAKKIAEARDLTGPEAVEFVKQYIYFHELFHLVDRDNGSRAEKETRAGETSYGFYSGRSESLKGTKLGKNYKGLAEESRVYAEGWRKGGLSYSKLESLITRYKTEAKELGIEDVEGYVASKLENKLREENYKSGLEEKLSENREKVGKEKVNPNETEKENYEGKEAESAEVPEI